MCNEKGKCSCAKCWEMENSTKCCMSCGNSHDCNETKCKEYKEWLFFRTGQHS